MVRALKDLDSAKWVGEQACQHPASRKILDRVRREIVSLAMCAGPAPGLTEAEIHKWINREVLDATHYDGGLTEGEVCLLLSPRLRRYDFPGYKRFENFVRFRIPPKFILGVVTNEANARHDSFIGTSRGYRIYLTDGTELSPK